MKKVINGILQSFAQAAVKHPGKALMLILVLVFAVAFLSTSTCYFARKNGKIEFQFTKEKLDVEAIKKAAKK